MERFTKKVDGVWTASCEYGRPPYPVVTQEVIDRLAAYEDTGFTPEEVEKMRWIPEEERLPKPEENPVLVYDYSGKGENFMKTFLKLTWIDKDNFLHHEIINVNNIEKIYIALPDETEISVSENVNGKRRKFSMSFEDKGKCFSEFSRICRVLCGGFYD